VTDSGQSPGAGPSVCPFVALAEDRDRRADSPDEGNRCYAERAPRQRDLSYQAEYCYSQGFSSCSVFLGWAARNAAQPAYASDAAQRAWSNSDASPDGQPEPADPADGSEGSVPAPTPESGLFGLVDPGASTARSRSEEVDWVSASAWAEVPWDERAELEADEYDEDFEDELAEEEDEEGEEEDVFRGEEATQAPKVPAAVPIRKRKRKQPVIRSRGSGEWYYADPPGREPLVKRRWGVTPGILLGVLGVLVAALVVFMIPTIFLGGGQSGTAALPSPPVDASSRPAATRAPQSTAAPSAEPSPTGEDNPRFYRVKAGDSLSGIAARFDVKLQHLQCINRIQNRNIIALNQRLEIPPDGFSCPSGWRNATPEP
jgi:nucleoid-associated protein YgaU